MQVATAARSPEAFTAGWRLQRERPNDYGYRDTPIERGSPAEAAESLPEELRKRLLNVDLHSIDSDQLGELTATLYWEGYISQDAFIKFAIFRFDHPGPVDLLAWTDVSRTKIRSGEYAEYPVAIQLYEAAIDAADGVRGVIEYLNGQLIDIEA
ncbi:hypothetical protein [Luteibacter sp.]|jgi:hypothetical protein|uniref:hypothetical protein n=1 Tax=Luteibacter sp. TaxID=1886636 RepID=UPI002F403E13